MNLHLVRELVTEDGVFGRLAVAGLDLYTLEDDWRENAPGQSCIPAGSYTLRRTIYVKHNYETFEVTGVPGRSRILIHPGNTEEDTMGCILLGLRRGRMLVRADEDSGQRRLEKQGVLGSREAFRQFMDAMDGIEEATLLIEWAADPGRGFTLSLEAT